MKKIRLEDDDEGVPSTALREVSVLMELGESRGPGAENVVRYVIQAMQVEHQIVLTLRYGHGGR